MRLSQDKTSGIYHVHFTGREGKEISRSTHETTKPKALAVVKAAKIEEMETAARGNLLNASALTAIMSGRSLTVAQAVDEWAECSRQDYISTTCIKHEQMVRQWMTFAKCGKWQVSSIRASHINDFLNADDGCKLATRQARRGAICAFVKFMRNRAYIVTNPAAEARIRKHQLAHELKETTKRRPVSRREYHHIMRNTTGFWRFATGLSYWTGLRLSDVILMEWASLTRDSEEIVVFTRKDEDRVSLPYSEPLIGGDELRQIITEILMEQSGADARFVFPEERALWLNPSTAKRFSIYYGRILKRIDITGVSFHCLRHAFATRLKRSGKTLAEIGTYLGHSDESTTKGYTH